MGYATGVVDSTSIAQAKFEGDGMSERPSVISSKICAEESLETTGFGQNCKNRQ